MSDAAVVHVRLWPDGPHDDIIDIKCSQHKIQGDTGVGERTLMGATSSHSQCAPHEMTGSVAGHQCSGATLNWRGVFRLTTAWFASRSKSTSRDDSIAASRVFWILEKSESASSRTSINFLLPAWCNSDL